MCMGSLSPRSLAIDAPHRRSNPRERAGGLEQGRSFLIADTGLGGVMFLALVQARGDEVSDEQCDEPREREAPPRGLREAGVGECVGCVVQHVRESRGEDHTRRERHAGWDGGGRRQPATRIEARPV
jgi:hypothetical protein